MALFSVRRLRVGALLGLLSGCGVGCSGTPGPKPTVQVPWNTASSGVPQGPARWVYTPPEPRGLLGRVSLEDGRELYFGRHGERWLVDREHQSIEAAGDLAEQDLVGAARSQGGWLFIGAGGALFEADSPLGSFQRALAAPEPVARVEASPQGLLAVTLRGSLLRSSDSGATFQKSVLDTPFASDVRLLEDGSGLLLAFPERLYETKDGGQQWSPVSAPTIGALRLHRFSADSVLVQGISGSLLWKKGGNPQSTREQPPESAFQLPESLGPGPDASLAHFGMSFWRGDRILQALPPEKRGLPWRLGVGRPGQRLEVTPLEDTESCHRLALHGNEQTLFAACSFSQRGASLAAVRLLKYGDSTGKPEALEGTLEGALGEVRIAVGRDGRVLLWGACRVGGTRSSCDGETPLLLAKWPQNLEAPAEGDASPWQAAVAPGQSGRPAAAMFGTNGRAYLVAQRGKNKEFGLFVSKDGGRTFEGRELGLAGALEESERRRLSGLRSAAISVADDGIVSMAFEGQIGALAAVTDEDGRVLSVSSVRGSPAVRVGLAGRRMLSVDGAAVAESLDGGVSWTNLGEIPSLRCPDRGVCERRIMCHESGCLVGNQVGRLGWGGQAENSRRSGEQTLPALGLLKAVPPPVVCKLGRDKWMPLPRGSELPSVYRADRGKVPWTSTAFTPANGQVLSVHAPAAGATKPEELTVLPPVKDTGRIAMMVSPDQIEGVAAARVELIPKTDGSSPGVQRIEVGWDNLFDGKLSRGTIPVPKESFPIALEPMFGQVSLLTLPLLSISNGGLFVRVDPAPRSDLFFLDHRGKLDRRSTPILPTSDAQGDDLRMRFEAVRVDSTSVVLGYQDALVARVQDRGNLDAIALFPPAGSNFLPESHLTFSYLNGAPFLVHIGRVPQVGASVVSYFPFRASGPLVGARTGGPSQRLLIERYRPCTSQDRSTTPRIIAPSESGTRRGVLIDGSDGSPFASMVSEGMVLYGTSESPCASVIEGIPAKEEQRVEGQERALVFLGDPEHSWFFRAGVGDAVEARMMSCKIAPGTPLPPEVQSAIDRRPASGGLTVTGSKPRRIRR